MSSRSASDPLPVSISASPQVACGRKMFSNPSPPTSDANAATRSVMSVTRSVPVPTVNELVRIAAMVKLPYGHGVGTSSSCSCAIWRACSRHHACPDAGSVEIGS